MNERQRQEASRRALLHVCYQAVCRAARAGHSPYADPQGLAMVGEAIAEKIEQWLTDGRKDILTFQAEDADTYDYFCAIIDEIHKTLPITRQINVVLHMERLSEKEKTPYATATIDGSG
jgi:hypothetical protein